jgi:hypothetical protein
MQRFFYNLLILQMPIIFTTSFNKQLKWVTHQLIPKPTQQQDE